MQVKPNRELRRRAERRNRKKRYSLEDVQRAMHIAAEMKKLTKGHLFSHNLKDKNGTALCTFCGQSMKTKQECVYWAMTLFDRIQTILINPLFFTDENIQALWLQHGEEYQNIKLPLSVTPKEKPNAKKTI